MGAKTFKKFGVSKKVSRITKFNLTGRVYEQFHFRFEPKVGEVDSSSPIYRLPPPAPSALPLKITSLVVPAEVTRGASPLLRCFVDTEGSQLYSVSWWSRGRPFFRYTPPPKERKTRYNDTVVTVKVSAVKFR